MSIYENLTNQQIREILDEAAKDQPNLLTSALRNAGNFVYLIVPEDILNYDDYQHEGKLKITEEEAAKTMSEFREKLADCVDYHTILESIADHILLLRKEKERNNGNNN